jgi:large subunit ribosomal protein L13
MKEIDAKGKKIGRIATQAAIILMGKDSPNYKPNILQTEGVHIVNASQIILGDKKIKGKKYSRYSGYPGGLKFESLEKVLEKHGYEEVFKRAIRGMLPNNKLRAEALKKIKITE